MVTSYNHEVDIKGIFLHRITGIQHLRHFQFFSSFVNLLHLVWDWSLTRNPNLETKSSNMSYQGKKETKDSNFQKCMFSCVCHELYYNGQKGHPPPGGPMGLTVWSPDKSSSKFQIVIGRVSRNQIFYKTKVNEFCRRPKFIAVSLPYFLFPSSLM